MQKTSPVIILLTTLSLGHPLKIQEIPNNGYYAEDIGKSNEINHYHRHILQINLEKLTDTLETNPNDLFDSPLENGPLAPLKFQYNYLLNEAKDNLHKITRKHKRGLFNCTKSAPA
ncbi:uncharacterized protein LOC130892741 [Diorhabda carinulata]|uniref:uncharacterized protein LOC130892741 n=1 Tax=Diorhabda carinulata TaxID=1163345 RepID=UPI0025A001CD|nr:uncharacterized protein LOC130892741 [Diorhabda carinulata]